MELTIGQQGKLGKEVLTVVSFNEITFMCDNGKSYMIKNALWMTEGAVVEAPKAKKSTNWSKKACEEGFYSDENAKNIDFDAIQQKSRMNQRGSSMR